MQADDPHEEFYALHDAGEDAESAALIRFVSRQMAECAPTEILATQK
jgi:hypothetical protein